MNGNGPRLNAIASRLSTIARFILIKQSYFTYFYGNKQEAIIPSIMEVTVTKLKGFLNELNNITDEDKFSRLAERIKSIAINQFKENQTHSKKTENIYERIKRSPFGFNRYHINALIGIVEVMIDELEFAQHKEQKDIISSIDNEFIKRNFHSEVTKHSQKLFMQGNYFHAVFESAKAYNKDVKEKAKSDKDGQTLMNNVWGCDNGVLKVTACQTQTDKDFQDGIRYISSGLMSAIRNSTAHEPAITWPIDKQDCLDILSLITFLYRQLDKSTYIK